MVKPKRWRVLKKKLHRPLKIAFWMNCCQRRKRKGHKPFWITFPSEQSVVEEQNDAAEDTMANTREKLGAAQRAA